VANFREKSLFVWNDYTMGTPAEVAAKAKAAGFEAVYLHATHTTNWRTASRVALVAACKALGLTVYGSVAVYAQATPAATEGAQAAAIVNQYQLAGMVFDVESGAYELAGGEIRVRELLTTYKRDTEKPAAFCGWALYHSQSGAVYHNVQVLVEAMELADVGMPMAYWYNGETPLDAENVAASSFTHWRKYTTKPLVLAGRAYTDTVKVGGVARTIHATGPAVTAFDARARMLGAAGVSWWDMEHGIKIPDVWAALAATKKMGEQNEEPKMDWTKNAIGFYTASDEGAAWDNPEFNFVVAQAGGNWSRDPSGNLVLEPNPRLAPIEVKARKKGLALFMQWDWDAGYYAAQQYDAGDGWPKLGLDYPYQRMIDSLAARDMDGLIIRVLNRKNFAGNDEAMNYIAFGAGEFMNRANKWLYTTKGLNKWTFPLTNDTFMRLKDKDGTSKEEHFYRWTKDWYLAIEQQAVLPLASGAWPQPTDKIKAIPPSKGWRLWYHYNATSLDMMIWNGTDADMRAFLGIAQTVPPDDQDPGGDKPPVVEVTKAQFDALAAQVTTLTAALAAHTATTTAHQHTHDVGPAK
jgi:hypothetical protein